jgi:hypothetical protein
MTPSPLALSCVLLLDGHLIDSLTLAKVIDLIEKHDAGFYFNDIRIGSRKKDFSFLSLTLFTRDAAHQHEILDLLKPYGVKLQSSEAHQETIRLVAAPKLAAELSVQNVYFEHLPVAIRMPEGDTLPIRVAAETVTPNAGAVWVVAVNQQQKTAILKPLALVGDEELVVEGTEGLLWE